MKPKAVLRLVIDIVMSAAMLLLMAYWLIGEKTHEWVGILVAALFIFHIFLNKNRIKSYFKGKYNAVRVFRLLIIVLLFASVFLLIASGIILSRYIFSDLNINVNLMTARNVHHTIAYWSFILASLHLGTHWSEIMSAIRKGASIKNPAQKRTVIVRCAGYATVIYGVAAFVKRNIGSYLFMRQMFTLFDDTQPLILFFADYIAIMCLFVLIGHYLAHTLSHAPKQGV